MHALRLRRPQRAPRRAVPAVPAVPVALVVGLAALLTGLVVPAASADPIPAPAEPASAVDAEPASAVDAEPAVTPQGEPTPSSEPALAPAPAWVPTLEVLAADGVTPLGTTPVGPGDEIVVRGTGFDPAANVGGRGVPVPATLPQGYYVVFGASQVVWRPSEGAPASARTAATQRWALTEETVDQVPSAYQGAVRAQWLPLAADGTFTVTLTITEPATLFDGGLVGVYVYPGGGVVDAEHELFVPVAYTPPAPAPALTVTPSEPLVAGRAATLTVSGTGYAAARTAGQGLYVNLGPQGLWAPGTPAPRDGWTASTFVPAALVGEDGTFTTTLAVPAGATTAGDHVVATFCAHACSATDRSLDAVSTALRVAADTPPTPPTTPTSGGGSARPVGDDAVRPGGQVTVEASGFGPGETGIRLELHSDPVVLATGLVADASGVVRVTATLPADTAPGQHSLVLVGATHTAAVPITVAAALPVCVARTVSGADLTWGVNGSFRAYVTGSVAHGSISTSGVAGSGPYTWSGGRGTMNTTDTVGGASFGGSVRFTGHGGALDLTIADPRVQVHSPTSGTLYAEVTSGGSRRTVALATLRLSAGSASADAARVRWTGVPATLTAAGAQAFEGFYGAGEAMDPVSFTLPLGAETPCTAQSGARLARYGGSLASTGSDALTGVALAVASLLAGTALVAVGRRARRGAAPA